MNYYIYKTTNLINNKQYIGKHIGELDDNYLGSGILITAAIKKYGKENFKKEILYIAKDEKQLNEKEKYYIELFNAVQNPNFYNIAEGGQGGNTLSGKTDQEIKEIYQGRKVLKGEEHPMYGKKLTEEQKNFLREESLKYWTEEKKLERSKKYTGEGNPMYGKHHTKETIEKIKANTDFTSYRTEEYRKKMSEATRGEKNGNYGNKGEKAKNGKHVLMYDENFNLIKEWNTKKMVLEFLQVKGHTALNKAIKEGSLYKGYYWKQI